MKVKIDEWMWMCSVRYAIFEKITPQDLSLRPKKKPSKMLVSERRKDEIHNLCIFSITRMDRL